MKNILIGVALISIPLFIGTAIYKLMVTINPKYIYIARGVTCKEFDKESNSVKHCFSEEFGEDFDIINPVSVIKVKADEK